MSSLDLFVNGPQVPLGSVHLSGAKNAATPMMAAAMLTDDRIQLVNFPTELVDVEHKARFIRSMGGQVAMNAAAGTGTFHCGNIAPHPLEGYGFPIRTTYLLAAGQLIRGGIAYIPYPGGCKLGDRRYDLHTMVWERFGCKVTERPDYIEVRGNLKATEVHFPISTVGGTENAILCASVAIGHSVIRNAYVTPEVENLIEMLNLMGARIEVRGTSRIEVEGVSRLRGTSIKVIPDRIEALTWIIFAAITGGTVEVHNVPFALMEVPLIHVRQAGLDFYANSNSISISASCLGPARLQPFELACGTHPGIISDMQPFFVMLALHAAGRSNVFDYRYPTRTAYLGELQKAYENAVHWETGRITLDGPKRPIGAEMHSTDLRGSMAMVMSAFVAEGASRVARVDYAMRGYDHLERKLRNLGLEFEVTPHALAVV